MLTSVLSVIYYNACEVRDTNYCHYQITCVCVCVCVCVCARARACMCVDITSRNKRNETDTATFSTIPFSPLHNGSVFPHFLHFIYIPDQILSTIF